MFKDNILQGKKILVISIDSNELYNDDGYVEEKVFSSIDRNKRYLNKQLKTNQLPQKCYRRRTHTK